MDTPQDEIHSIFFLSEKEAKIKQKEQILEQRQKELEQRADEINRILKSFNNSQSVGAINVNELPLQSDCKSRNQMPLTTLLASHVSSHDNMAAQSSEKMLAEEEAKGSKYESPKFFVGSGSPSARKAQCATELDTQEEDKEAKEIGSSKLNMQNGNFFFQQRQ